MLANREEKQEQTFKEFIINALSNLAPQAEIENFAERLDQAAKKINAELKNTVFIDNADKLLNAFGSILQGQSPSEELLASKLLEFTQQENIQEEKEAELLMTALKQHMEALSEISSGGNLTYDFVKKINHAEKTSQENLALHIAELLNTEFKNCTQTTSVADVMAAKFINQLNETKDFYKIRESVTLFACEKMYYPNLESNAFNLHQFHEKFSQHIEKFVDNIDKKYEPLYESITKHFIATIEPAMPLFEKTMAKIEAPAELSEHKENNSVEQFQQYAKEKLHPFIRQQIRSRQKATNEIAYFIIHKNNKSMLAALKNQHELLSNTDELNKNIVKLHHEWTKEKNVMVPLQQIEASFIEEIQHNISDGCLQNSIALFSWNNKVNNELTLFKSASQDFLNDIHDLGKFVNLKKAYEILDATVTQMESEALNPEMTENIRETISPLSKLLK